ncbi:MAG: DUF6603 domain-containing protein [Pseudomonadota bacterium]
MIDLKQLTSIKPTEKSFVDVSPEVRLEVTATRVLDSESNLYALVWEPPPSDSGRTALSFGNLLGLCGLRELDQLPQWLKALAEVSLRGFGVVMEEGSISYIQVTVELSSDHRWMLVENFLGLEGITLNMRARSPFDEENASIELAVGGKIILGEIALGVNAVCPNLMMLGRQPEDIPSYEDSLTAFRNVYPDVNENDFKELFDHFAAEGTEGFPPPSFQVEGSLLGKGDPDAGEEGPLYLPVTLRDVFRGFAWNLPEGVDGFGISALDFRFDTGDGSCYFFIDISNTFEVISDPKLALKDLFATVSHDGSPGNGLVGEIGAVVTFCEAEISVKALCSAADGGWQFEGSYDNIDEHEVTKDSEWFTTGLKDFFPGIELPSILTTDFCLNKLFLSFNTKSKAFSFTCDCTLTIREKKIEAMLAIDIAPEGEGFREKFGGQVIVTPEGSQPIFFELGIEHEEEQTSLLAAYRDPEGTKLPLDRLIGEFFSFESLPQWNIGVHDAFFVHRDGLNLFGLDIDGGIDLSQIHLPDLPLVGAGDIFGPDETLRLSFQGIVLTRLLKEDERKDLAGLLGQHGLKFPPAAKALKVGPNVDISLQLGSETRQLSAPKIDTQSSEPLKVDGPSADAINREDKTQWINIQKSFGPIHMERVGLRFEDGGRISGLLDGHLTAAGLTVALEGLTVTSSFSDLTDVRFDLQGLGIDYRNDQVELGGAFLKQTPTYQGKKITVFAGSAVLRAEQLALSAVGVYAKFHEHPSLFVYAVLDSPIGGPAFFFVTGLAAGFGYNRALEMPPIAEVASFPLITQAKKPADQEKDLDPLEQLNALEQHLPPAIGEDFLAVGVHFTSFKQIDSFALLILQFGERLEIDLLGLSTLLLPPKKAEGKQLSSPAEAEGKQPSSPAEAKGKQLSSLVEAELAIKASFVPEEGTLRIRGLLTPKSYVLSHENHLRGGFAFYSWFLDTGDAKAGDFVATLGGYHPSYHVPAHYPTVPRLALQWKVSDNLNIKGSAYFALTAHAFMVGGRLEAVWQSKDVRAWFTAEADFLIAWQPYYYEAGVLVEMGADVTIHFAGTHHLSFEGGASIQFSGPEFAGHAHIDGKVLGIRVNFDMNFGQTQRPEAINWVAFKEAFLPEKPCGIAVQNGLLRTTQDDNAVERWIVDPTNAAFTVTSAVPITNPQSSLLGIRPMGLKANSDDAFVSSLEVTIDGKPCEDRKFNLKPVRKAVPSALWSQPKKVSSAYDKRFVDPPDLNGESLVENIVMGFTVQAAERPEGEHTQGLQPKTTETHGCPDEAGWQTPEADNLPWGVPMHDDASVSRSKQQRERREDMLKALKIPVGGVAFPHKNPAAFYGLERVS